MLDKTITEEIEHVRDLEITRTDDAAGISKIRTVDFDNYHGLTPKTVLVFLAICLTLFGQLLDLIGAGAFARNIATDVGGTSESSWLSAIIAVETCVFGPLFSQAADFWGRKWIVVIPTMLGAVGALIISRAGSMSMAIGGQVVAGFCFGSQPLAYAIASEIVPRKWRPEAQAILSFASAAGALFALLVGGKIAGTSQGGWRIFYYILGGVNAFASVVCILFYNPLPLPLQTSLTSRQKLAMLDWTGYTLFVPGLVSFFLGLFWSKNPYPWTDFRVLVPFIVGLVLLILFILFEWRIKKDGVIHHGLFKNDRNCALGFFTIFVEGLVFFSVSVYYVLEMSVIYDTNSYIAVVRFSIVFLVSVVGATVVAFYMSSAQKLRVPSMVGFICFTIFLILMATASTSSGTAMWGYSIFAGLGLGSVLTTLVTAIQLSAPHRLIAISSGLTLSIRSFGGAIGLAIYSAIFNAQLSSELPKKIAAAVLPLGLPPADLSPLIEALADNNQAAVAHIPGLTPAIIGAAVKALKEAYLESLRYVWITAAVFTILAVIASCFFINPHGEMTMHVDAPLDDELTTRDTELN